MIITIRKFNEDTDSGLLDFQDNQAVIHAGGTQMTASITKEDLNTFVSNDGFWLATVDDKCIGALLVGPSCQEDRHYASIYGIAVDEPYRHRGLGGLLMHKADLFADKNGISQIIVTVRKDNQSALVLFRKCWFSITGSTDGTLTMMKTRMKRR